MIYFSPLDPSSGESARITAKRPHVALSKLSPAQTPSNIKFYLYLLKAQKRDHVGYTPHHKRLADPTGRTGYSRPGQSDLRISAGIHPPGSKAHSPPRQKASLRHKCKARRR